MRVQPAARVSACLEKQQILPGTVTISLHRWWELPALEDHMLRTLQGPGHQEERELLRSCQGLSSISAETGYEEPLINSLTH